jgi:hypothetical protein
VSKYCCRLKPQTSGKLSTASTVSTVSSTRIQFRRRLSFVVYQYVSNAPMRTLASPAMSTSGAIPPTPLRTTPITDTPKLNQSRLHARATAVGTSCRDSCAEASCTGEAGGA